MPVLSKRWDDLPVADDGMPLLPDPADGERILVCRYRPRGVPEADETWDSWLPELAPSPALLGWAKEQIRAGRLAGAWSEYARRYLAEMRAPGPQALIAELAWRHLRGETFTLLCSSGCTDERYCHRTLLRGLILAAAGGR